MKDLKNHRSHVLKKVVRSARRHPNSEQYIEFKERFRKEIKKQRELNKRPEKTARKEAA